MTKCYAITSGEYSDYRVLAIFSTREEAEQQLPLWDGDEVEELPYNVTVPQPPAGMKAYGMSRHREGGHLPGPIETYVRPSAQSVHKRGDEVFASRTYFPSANPQREFLHTYMFARDVYHAIEIASERFAKYDAIKAGIAC